MVPSHSTSRPRQRLLVDVLSASAEIAGADVIAGLTQRPKALPPKYFYDDRGSQLFEQITQLPEYYLTRTETALLQEWGDAIATLTSPCELVELGSGSSTKTRLLLDAYQRQGAPLRYLPIDVSGGMLKDTAARLLQDYPPLTIHGLAGTYGPALAALPPRQQPARLIAFIGSSLGNLTPAESQGFLAQISDAMEPGDYFLLGVDLQKEVHILEAAYNDAQGITAAFNLNMLHHLNRRFQGDFQPEHFQHVAFYNAIAHQIEIYLESRRDQRVQLAALDLTVDFAPGERLLSEISRKFDRLQLERTLAGAGLQPVSTFTDTRQWFALLLAVKPDATECCGEAP